MIAKIKRKNKTSAKTQFVKAWKKLTKNFNLYAFIFNSLYYLVKGMPGWFCIYALAPWFLVLLSVSMFGYFGQTFKIIAIITSILVVHVISGFLANGYLKDKKKTNSRIDFEAPTEYLAISGKRLFCLSALSGGGYLLYWMYKNWSAVKAATKENIQPIFRAYLFPVLFVYPLFLRIQKSSEEYVPVSRLFKICGILAVLLWLIISIFDLGIQSTNWNTLSRETLIGFLAFEILCALIFTPLFLPAQKVINTYNAKEFPERELKQKLTWGEYAITFTGFVLEYALLIGYICMAPSTQSLMPNLMKLSEQQQVAIGQTIGHAYRNIQGYKTVCADSNFELKNYPEEFKAAMADELDGLEQVLMRDNVSLEQSFNIFIQGDIWEQIQEELYNELKVIASPDDEGVASACQLLDADAADIAQNVADEIRPFYHEILTPLFKK